MKKIITSASLAVIGVASLQAADTQGLSKSETAKPWSVSASLRGFYDDNYTTLPSKPSVPGGVSARSSWGMDVSPRVSLNYPMDATLISADYAYGMRYYADRSSNSADQSHQADIKFEHQFSEQYKISVTDSFVVAQEPELLNPKNSGLAMFLRADGSNIRNSAGVKFDAQLTRLLGLEAAYNNNYYSYDKDVYSDLLDRTEHIARLDSRWQVLNQTTGIFGYQFQYTGYNGDGKTLPTNFLYTNGNLDGVNSKTRDNRSHYIYVGADHNFTALLNGSVRVGAQITEYNKISDLMVANAATQGVDLKDNSVSPYVDASLSYAFTTGSYVQVGIKHTRVTTDLSMMDQEATTAYGAVSYRITPRFVASATGQAQFGDYYASANKGGDDYYSVGANLAYDIMVSPFALTAETGYNFDRLDSDWVSRSFSRNRVYFGFRAQY